MRQLASNVYILNYKEDCAPRYFSGSSWNHPYFKDKIVITFWIDHKPEKVWPPSDTKNPCKNPNLLGHSNNEMIAFCNRNIGILLGARVIDLGANFRELIQNFDSPLKIATEFGDIKIAHEAFKRAVAAGFIDIYLYMNSTLYDKLD